jgi:hypothetical protein
MAISRRHCRRERRFPTIPLVILMLATLPAAAEVTLTSQVRSLHTSFDGELTCSAPCVSGPVSGAVDVAAPDFDPFSAALHNAGSIPSFPFPFGIGGATASQESTLTTGSIVGEGAAQAVGFEFNFGDYLLVSTTASTRIIVEFEVDSPTAYMFNGTLEFSSFPLLSIGEAGLELIGPEGVISSLACVVDLATTTCDVSPESRTGTLLPGLHSIEAVISGTGSIGVLGGGPDSFGSGSYSFALTLDSPELAPSLSPQMLLLLVATLLFVGHRLGLRDVERL